MPLDYANIQARLEQLHQDFQRYRDTWYASLHASTWHVQGAARVSFHPNPPDDRFQPFVGALNTRPRPISAHQSLRKHQDEGALLTQASALARAFAAIPLFCHPHFRLKVTFCNPVPTMLLDVDGHPLTPHPRSPAQHIDELRARIPLLARVAASGPFAPFALPAGKKAREIYAPALAEAMIKHSVMDKPALAAHERVPRSLPRGWRHTAPPDTLLRLRHLAQALTGA